MNTKQYKDDLLYGGEGGGGFSGHLDMELYHGFYIRWLLISLCAHIE